MALVFPVCAEGGCKLRVPLVTCVSHVYHAAGV